MFGLVAVFVAFTRRHPHRASNTRRVTTSITVLRRYSRIAQLGPNEGKEAFPTAVFRSPPFGAVAALIDLLLFLLRKFLHCLADTGGTGRALGTNMLDNAGAVGAVQKRVVPVDVVEIVKINKE